jgi:hypothetical protein
MRFQVEARSVAEALGGGVEVKFSLESWYRRGMTL